jgi:hypothetical protein
VRRNALLLSAIHEVCAIGPMNRAGGCARPPRAVPGLRCGRPAAVDAFGAARRIVNQGRHFEHPEPGGRNTIAVWLPTGGGDTMKIFRLPAGPPPNWSR